jgi:hypothetical protein
LTHVPRRYINFIAECYTLKTDTFFDLDRTPWARGHGMVKRMLRRRLVRQQQRDLAHP